MKLISHGRWWLHGADEVCAFCLQSFGRGVEMWCVACDRAMCLCCAPSERTPDAEPVCPDCLPTRREG